MICFVPSGTSIDAIKECERAAKDLTSGEFRVYSSNYRRTYYYCCRKWQWRQIMQVLGVSRRGKTWGYKIVVRDENPDGDFIIPFIPPLSKDPRRYRPPRQPVPQRP